MRDENEGTFKIVLFAVCIAALLILAILNEIDPEPALTENQMRALRAAGMTDIQPGGTTIKCSDSDSYFASRRFTATNPQGVRVSGVVCCGIAIKRCTLRF